MKYTQLRILAIALVVGVCACSLVLAGPKIQFDKETINFGTITGTAAVKVSFTLTNTGDQDLVISDVRAGCHCTTTALKEKTLAPGKSTTIDAQVDTNGVTGPVSKQVTVTSNDPGRPSVVLQIVGEIVTVAKLNPERINFGTIKVNTTCSHTIRVLPADPKNFAIKEAHGQGTYVTVQSFKKYEDAKTGAYYDLNVVITAGPQPGRVYERVVINTNATANGQDVSITALVYGNVSE